MKHFIRHIREWLMRKKLMRMFRKIGVRPALRRRIHLHINIPQSRERDRH